MKTLQEKMDELPEVSRRRVMAESDEIFAEHISNRTMTRLDQLIDELPVERRRRVLRRAQEIISEKMALRSAEATADSNAGLLQDTPTG